MHLIIFSFTEKGSALGALLKQHLPEFGYTCEGYTIERCAKKYGLKPQPESIREYMGAIWGKAAILFIGAAGIAVRMIAPYVRDKFTDSAVVVTDEMGRFVIPILSGHVGGAVEIAKAVAVCTRGTAVLTTATDVQGRFAVDVFAKKNRLVLTDRRCAKEISAALLEGKEVGLFSKWKIAGDVPEGVRICSKMEELEDYEYGIVITDSEKGRDGAESISMRRRLGLLPGGIVVGIGCRKGFEASGILEGVGTTLAGLGIRREQIAAFASIDLKKEEQGIRKTAEEYQVPFLTFTAEALRSTGEVSQGSDFVEKITGVDNVCERAVRYVCGEEGELLLAKTCLKGMTIAVGRKKISLVF